MKDKRGGEGAWEFRVMCCAFTRGGVWKKGDEMLWKREGGRWRGNTNNREQRDGVHLILGDGKGG